MPDTNKQKPAPPLVVFLVKNAAFGFLTALIFVGTILAFDVGNVMTVAGRSDVGIFAMILMTLMIGFTFASLQMGFAVMFRAGDIGKNDNDRGDPAISPEDIERLRLQPVSAKTHRTGKLDR